jgi:hypothetical protein
LESFRYSFLCSGFAAAFERPYYHCDSYGYTQRLCDFGHSSFRNVHLAALYSEHDFYKPCHHSERSALRQLHVCRSSGLGFCV